ncbi:choice-of-anchor I family protein [Pontibacillus yanchengensis]|uniref:choice-of-anchor I family protein n=1 Tax=Pontibacillus yanchengensis TaxID=462910 RepID=UPI000691439F|nr:choice-of-anchor I family protein [Pontibacillus yanchengensis]
MKHGKKSLYSVVTTATLLAGIALPTSTHAETTTSYGKQDFYVQHIGHFDSEAALDEGGTEIVTFDQETERIFSVNGAEQAVDIIDASGLEKGQPDVENMPLIERIQLAELNDDLGSVDGITSVALHPSGDYLAVAVPADPKTDNGYVVFMDKLGNYLSHVEVGALPDMVTFTPDGEKALVANEGEPSEDYTTNPEGSVGIIDVSNGVKSLKNEQVNIVNFEGVDVEDSVRKTNAEVSYEKDLEPEYITVQEDSKRAFVVLQESNAMATLNLETEEFEGVSDLGYKDHSKAENALDTSNEDDGVNIDTYPILGMYQPDGITSFSANGKTYIVTPNEGDSVDYDGYSEETEVAEIKDQYELNADHFAEYTQEELDQMVENGLFSAEQTGELGTTTAAPKNEDGKYEAIYKFGARSFTIWDAEDMSRVYDSGDEFEQVTANALPDMFNIDNTENEIDGRSDNKGPEPETVVTGMVEDKHYAFVGLERIGGVMVYDITNPEKASFVKYFSSRDFSNPEEVAGDIGPEGLKFVSADESPTGNAMLVIGHEVSGTVGVFDLSHQKPMMNDDSDEEDEEEETEEDESEDEDMNEDDSESEENDEDADEESDMDEDEDENEESDMDENEDQEEESDMDEVMTHTVEMGDTLYSIAQMYDTSWENLQELNELADPTFIIPGQKLIISY